MKVRKMLPAAAQVAGGGCVVAAVALLAGPLWGLLLLGGALVALGTLAEGGRL